MDLGLITQEREDVWYILSELFLDTGFDETQLFEIAVKLAQSSFPTEELCSIMENEVAPILHTNLLVLGGDWCYFERQSQVVEPIRKYLAVVPDVKKNGWWPFAVLRRKLQMLSVDQDWQKVLSHIKSIRASTKSGA